MGNFTQSILEKVENLLNQGIGDISRLEHIKDTIIENKKLYNSDIQYVKELEGKIQDSLTENSKDFVERPENSCWKCSKELAKSSEFCSFCGVKQNHEVSEFDQVLSRRIKREYNPIKIISNFHSYQILAVIGGLAALIPILISASYMERIIELIEFYTGQDLSGFFIAFMAIGVISGILCSVVIVVPFWIKKPKKVGRILFFSSFGILIFSIFVGIVGFVIILFAGILALKKRKY